MGIFSFLTSNKQQEPVAFDNYRANANPNSTAIDEEIFIERDQSGDYSICGHLFRGTWPHITAQNDQLISLKNGQPAYFKPFLASRKALWDDNSFRS
jgi:hypothetical protein